MEGFDLGTASAVYVGDHSCSAVYLGNDKVWGGGIDYSKEYLTFEIVEDGTITIKAGNNSVAKTISYSTNEGDTWTDLTTSTTEQSLGTFSVGDKVLLKGTNTTYGITAYGNQIGGTSKYNACGNIMSLLYGDDFLGKTVFPSGSTYTFNRLFYSSTGLVDASNIILPATTLVTDCYLMMFYGCSSLTTAPSILTATTLAEGCYYGMFYGCTSLKAVPELPATTLVKDCYYYMFYNCTSLTTAPKLPATTLARGCYQLMFSSCTSLTIAPELPATILVRDCYQSMFNGCTSLTTAPELPATSLTSGCYNYMFGGCTNLNYIKAMFRAEPVIAYTRSWVQGVASTGTFVKNASATWTTTGVNGIPTGWTVQTASA